MEKNWRKQRKRDRNCFPRDGSVWVGWHRHETKRHKEQQRYQADEFLVKFLSFLSDKFPRIDEVVWRNNGGSQETRRSPSEQLWKQNHGDPSFAFEIIDFECVILTTSCGTFPFWHAGSFAGLSVIFSFKRRLEYFVSSVFSPGVTLVMLSWCCFWISRDAVPARASLGITIILTAIVLCGSVNEAMPPVSYSKAQDYFLLVSFGFIFLSFLEFVIVLNTDPDPKWLQCLLVCLRLRPKKVISPNFYINSTSFLALNHVLYSFLEVFFFYRRTI